jgi:hypothetical protein
VKKIMSQTQDQNKLVRPSLYGTGASTSTFSVLGAVTSFSGSRQHVVLASVASFILGGLMGGGIVGIVSQSVSQSEPKPAISTSALPAKTFQTTPKISNPKLISTSNSMNPQIIQPTEKSTISKSSQAAVTSEQGLTAQPIHNPLASFQTIADKEIINKKEANPILTQPVHQIIDQPKTIAHRDDLAMQKLIKTHEHKADHQQALGIEKERLENERLEKENIEAAFKSEQPIKDMSLSKESISSKSTVKPKKSNTRDKDILLVKSLLDTMDHPASKTKVTQITGDSSVPLNK